MPVYCYRNEDGDRHEIVASVEHAPAWDIYLDGVHYWRDLRSQRIGTTAASDPSKKTRHIEPMSLPAWWPYAKKHNTDPSSRNFGQPQFETQHEIDEAVAYANDHGENVTYDD